MSKKSQLDNTPKWYSKSYIILIGLLILSAALYSSVFDNSLHFDDTFWHTHSVITDSQFDEVHTINLQRTIPFMSFAVQYKLHGNDFTWYYIFNILIHGLNAFFVFLLIKTLLKSPLITDQKYLKYAWHIALIISLIFLVHPLMTQAVAYIYQRLTSLAAMFYLGTMYFYAESRLGGKKNLNLTLALVFLLLGLFTKENVYTLPIMIILFEVFFVSGLSYIKSKRFYIPAIIMLVLFGIVGIKMGPKIFSSTLPYYDGTTLTPLNYLFTQFSVVIEYIRLLILPINLNLDYEYTLAGSLFGFREILTLLLNAAVIFAGVKLYKNHKLMSFAIFWFYLTLSVESSIIPIKDVINEHRLYLPMLGFVLFIISASVTYLIKHSIKPLYYIGAVLILIYSGMTISRLSVWEDEYTLWNDVITKSPSKSRGYINRATELNKQSKYRDAYTDFSKAIEIDPYASITYLNRASTLFALKDYAGSLKDINRYMELEPRSIAGIQTRANANFAVGNYQEAADDYSEYIENTPQKVLRKDTYINRALSYGHVGNFEAAFKDIKRAVKNGGDAFGISMKMGNELFNDQNYSNCIIAYQEALTHNKNSHDAFNNIGTSFFFLKDYSSAIENYKKSIDIDPSFEKAYINLGMVFSASEQYNNAIDIYDKYLKIKPDHPQSLFFKAQAYKGLKDTDKATEILKYAVNKYPKFDQAKMLLDSLTN